MSSHFSMRVVPFLPIFSLSLGISKWKKKNLKVEYKEGASHKDLKKTKVHTTPSTVHSIIQLF